MSYKLKLTDEAQKQLLQWKKSGKKKDLAKIFSLFQEFRRASDHRNRTGRAIKRQPFWFLE